MSKSLKYVKDFEFPGDCGFSGSAGTTMVRGYARGGATRRGPEVRSMDKREMMATPKMQKREVVRRESVKAPSAPLGMLRDASALGIRGNRDPGERRSMPVAPREPMIPLKKGGAIPKAGQAKIGKVMGEYKAGELHSGSKSGPLVKSREQALAIALSEARKRK